MTPQDDLQATARDHLLLNFTDMAAFTQRSLPIIARGDGCQVVDAGGRRFIDAFPVSSA